MIPVTIYETKNTFYIVDIIKSRYMRICKNLLGRNITEIAMLTPNLIDDVWLELEPIENAVELIDIHGEECLQIRYLGSKVGLYTTKVLSIANTQINDLVFK